MFDTLVKVITGWVRLRGATDDTFIGNTSDSLKTNVTNAAGASAVNVQDGGNSITIDATSLPLPTGASTSANQTTQITALQLIDDIPHSQNAALNKGVPLMGQLDDTATTAATENNVAVVRITAQRAAHANLRSESGTELGTNTNPVDIRDKFQIGYVSGSVSVGTSAVEAKVGGSRVSTRKMLYIENTGTTDIYYGPATVTTANGAILRRRQFVFLPAGDITIQVISSASGGSVIVQEMS